jgi:FtsP/CotA-like multicopper oxidase with cupredoxin domain
MRDLKVSLGQVVRGIALAYATLLTLGVQAAVPGITSAGGDVGTFNLTASAAYVSQPDGASVYSWGYGCTTGAAATFAPALISGSCGAMQLPGPTLIVTQGATVSVTLTNSLPDAAGNTSILFPGFKVKATGGAAGVLTQEATHTSPVTYTFVADTAGTHSYYSGTQGDLQVEMGLYGALIVLPSKAITSSGDTTYVPLNGAVPTGYSDYHSSLGPAQPDTCFELTSDATAGPISHRRGDGDFRLAAAAFDNPATCYDREYLFQFSEMDPAIHARAQAQATLPCGQNTGCMNVETEPYHPAYFLINGRSFPDVADPNYASAYPNQPYNGNPHMHPGELTLVRVIGQGRLQHPFHEHANHLRVLARDGNQLLTSTNKLAGPLLFTTTTTPGQALDAIFQYTGKDLNWDVYGHGAADINTTADSITGTQCHPDANGYYTTGSGAPADAPNYYEWCGDHGKPLESKPFGNVGGGGPVTLPDPTILANGAWYGGSPYLGPEATKRAVGSTPIPPSGTVGNSPTDEAGFAYMWHSHNEREITTNNIFPGGMMMMMLVDPWVFQINEAN